MESRSNLNRLYERYLKRECDAVELRELFGYFRTQDEQVLRELISKELDKTEMEAYDGASREAKLGVLYGNIRSRIGRKSYPYARFLPYAAAAMFLIVLGFGAYHYFLNDRGANKAQLTTRNDVGPGGNHATLTLADGTKMRLDEATNGILAEESGIKIIKTEDGQIVYGSQSRGARSYTSTYNTIETPRGGQYKIILPDSSVVWLNAASSLRFPTRFDSTERRVELKGEAYFQVAKANKVEGVGHKVEGGKALSGLAALRENKIPFIVATEGQVVEVIGTQFNMSAYEDEAVVKTTLLEGSIKVSPTYWTGRQPATGNSQILKPNQQSIRSPKGLSVVNVDVENVIAWKKGDFMLGEEDFKTTMRKIARWYDVDIVYGDDAPTELELGGWVSRSKNISAVLKIMESTGKVHFKIEKERRVIVTK